MTESRLQQTIIRFLKDHGCYVIKTKPQPGIPVGCPDIIGLYMDQWLAIEVKKSAKAADRPGQKPTREFLRQNNYFVYRADPENWAEIKEELIAKFFL